MPGRRQPPPIVAAACRDSVVLRGRRRRMTMHRFHSLRPWLAAAVAAAWLLGCGGGDVQVPGSGSPAGAPTTKGSFTAVVSFGDSLSDAGTYAPATSLGGNGQPPYFGGKFTTNSATGTVWVENLAATLGIVVTPAEVG